MIKLFERSLLPDQYGQLKDLYTFPSTYRLNIVIKKDKINTADTDPWFYISNRDLALTSFKAEPMNGSNEEMLIKGNSKIETYKVSMDFITIQKVYNESKLSLEDQTKDVANKYGVDV